MTILIICDIKEWAIGRLTDAIIKHNPQHRFITLYVHPRNVNESVPEINRILKEENIDLVHSMYWRSGTQVIDMFPQLKQYKHIISHHNTEHLRKADWKKYADVVVAPTKFVCDSLKEVHNNVEYIPYGIDFDTFTYITERTDDEKTLGYCGRVIPHKNLKLLCDIANTNDYRVEGSGYIEDGKYYETIDKKNLTFHGGAGRGQMNTWEDKNAIYEKMTVYVMASSSYETGPLPMLEAMARGIPVVCTRQGMANDIIRDFENGIFIDENNAEEKINIVMNDRKLQEELRRNARKTIQQYSEEKMAIRYGDLYTKTLYPNTPLVSVIMPTYNNKELLAEKLESLEQQDYENFEVIVSDDGSDDGTEEMMNTITTSYPLRYIRREHTGYGLARSRNLAIIEARGKLLVFADDRLKLHDTAIDEFIKRTSKGEWTFGAKYLNGEPAKPRGFVENFSCVHKEDVMKIGMCTERMEWYGGMSQDIRTRTEKAGIKHRYIESAGADVVGRASKMKKPEEQWRSKLTLWKMYGE